ncbi:hypothetical protein TNCV_168381 [Trichonephila clavipes]|nr:hypothetical protein TNCV_168381 [Trichonephila clavipes]
MCPLKPRNAMCPQMPRPQLPRNQFIELGASSGVALVTSPKFKFGSPLTLGTLWNGAVGSLVVRARKAWVRCPMPPNTLRVLTVYVLVKSVSQKAMWVESRVQGTGEYFPLVPCQNWGGGDRCRHLSSLLGILTS